MASKDKANPGLARKIMWVVKQMNLKEGDVTTSRKVYLEVKYYANKGKIDLSILKEYKSDDSADKSLVKCCEFVLQGLAERGFLKKETADRLSLQEPGAPNRQYRVLVDSSNIPEEDVFLPNEMPEDRRVIIGAVAVREALKQKGIYNDK